jgi:hypothetical protein
MNPLPVPNLYTKLWIVGRAVTEDATNGVVLIYAFRARCTTFCGHMVNVFKFIHTSTYSYGVDQGGPMSWCIKRPLIHLCFVPLSYNIWWKKINNNLETFMICVFKVLDFVHAFRFITWVYATLDFVFKCHVVFLLMTLVVNKFTSTVRVLGRLPGVNFFGPIHISIGRPHNDILINASNVSSSIDFCDHSSSNFVWKIHAHIQLCLPSWSCSQC